MSWRRRRPGWSAGPSRLKIVRTASSRAHGDDEARRLMVGGREHEAEADLARCSARRLGRRGRCARPSASSRSAEPGRLGGRAVAVLGHRAARAGGDQRRRGRDVEGAPPAAGAGRVEQVARGRSDTGVASSRIVRASPASSSTVSPLVRSAIRKPAICDLGGLAGHDLGEHRRRSRRRSGRGREASASIALRERSALGISCSPRKFASSSLPSSVSTDSGWNCTPSAGSSRWRTPSRRRRRARMPPGSRAAADRRRASGSGRPSAAC